MIIYKRIYIIFHSAPKQRFTTRRISFLAQFVYDEYSYVAWSGHSEPSIERRQGSFPHKDHLLWHLMWLWYLQIACTNQGYHCCPRAVSCNKFQRPMLLSVHHDRWLDHKHQKEYDVRNTERFRAEGNFRKLRLIVVLKEVCANGVQFEEREQGRAGESENHKSCKILAEKIFFFEEKEDRHFTTYSSGWPWLQLVKRLQNEYCVVLFGVRLRSSGSNVNHKSRI